MNIRKSKDNFNKDGRLKCYKCKKVGHLAKDCRSEQKMKTRSIQEESDKKDNDNKEDFVKGLEQI